MSRRRSRRVGESFSAVMHTSKREPRSMQTRIVEFLEQRNSPSDSLGLLAAFPLADWFGGAGEFAPPPAGPIRLKARPLGVRLLGT